MILEGEAEGEYLILEGAAEGEHLILEGEAEEEGEVARYQEGRRWRRRGQTLSRWHLFRLSL